MIVDEIETLVESADVSDYRSHCPPDPRATIRHLEESSSVQGASKPPVIPSEKPPSSHASNRNLYHEEFPSLQAASKMSGKPWTSTEIVTALLPVEHRYGLIDNSVGWNYYLLPGRVQPKNPTSLKSADDHVERRHTKYQIQPANPSAQPAAKSEIQSSTKYPLNSHVSALETPDRNHQFSLAHKINPVSRPITNRRKRCLVVHDDQLRRFDTTLFPTQFEVESLFIGSLTSTTRNTETISKLMATVARQKCDAIFIYLGSEDIASKRREDQSIKALEDLLIHLLKHTSASICYSLVIPTSTRGSHVNLDINSFNYEATEMIDRLRARNQNIPDRLFSYRNDALAWYNKKDSSGKTWLTSTGAKLAWKKVEDALKKTLRLPRSLQQRRSTSTTQNDSLQNSTPNE